MQLQQLPRSTRCQIDSIHLGTHASTLHPAFTYSTYSSFDAGDSICSCLLGWCMYAARLPRLGLRSLSADSAADLVTGADGVEMLLMRSTLRRNCLPFGFYRSLVVSVLTMHYRSYTQLPCRGYVALLSLLSLSLSLFVSVFVSVSLWRFCVTSSSSVVPFMWYFCGCLSTLMPTMLIQPPLSLQ